MSNEKISFNIDEAVDFYFNKKLSAKEIANIYGFKTHKSILDKLKSAGYKLRSKQNQNTVSEEFKISNPFDAIDSDIKGYLLGLFLGDSLPSDDFGYICFDLELADYVKRFLGIEYVIKDSSLFVNPSNKRNLKSKCYYFKIDNIDNFNICRFKSQYNWLEFNCDLSFNEMAYLSQIMRGIFDSSGTFGFPSNNAGSIFFKISSKNKEYIDWCFLSLNILGMRNICRNINANGEFEIYSAQRSNIEILVNSIYSSKIGCNFKKEKILKVYINR